MIGRKLSAWANNYVGLPFKADGRTREGVDCYGLVCLVYKELHNIDLNPFTGIFVEQTPEKMIEIARIMNKDRDNWLRGDKPQTFDMVQLRTGRHAFHVGIMVDGKRMLHVEEGIDSVIESIRSPLWANRIEWIYRHPCLM